MKKLLSSLLAVSVLFGSAAYLVNPNDAADMNFGTQAYAADIVKSGECGENLTWTLDSEGLLSIKGTGKMAKWDFQSIAFSPNTLMDIEFYTDPVPWFDDRYSIKRVEIGSGVENIGDLAFAGLENMESIIMPDSITDIGTKSFLCCRSLKKVNIPYGTQNISRGAFYGCCSMESVNIPSTVTEIGTEAFHYCSALTEIAIPNSVEIINNELLKSCSNLTSVKFSASVKEIDCSVLEECPALKNVIVMNPECGIEDALETLGGAPERCDVYGYEGSTAQEYARKYGYRFISIMLGDTDRDKTVNASDASLILADYASSATGEGHILTVGKCVAADVNSDNAVDSSDASVVLAYYAYTATGGSLSLEEFMS